MTTKTKKTNVFVNAVAEGKSITHLSIVKNAEPLPQFGTLEVVGDKGTLHIYITPRREVSVSSLEEAKQEMLKAFRHI